MRRLLHIATVHILSMLCVVDLSLILLNTSSGIFQIQKNQMKPNVFAYFFIIEIFDTRSIFYSMYSII